MRARHELLEAQNKASSLIEKANDLWTASLKLSTLPSWDTPQTFGQIKQTYVAGLDAIKIVEAIPRLQSPLGFNRWMYPVGLKTTGSTEKLSMVALNIFDGFHGECS